MSGRTNVADDFRGTSPKGTRYDKPTGEPAYEPGTQWSTDCRLDDADVRVSEKQDSHVALRA